MGIFSFLCFNWFWIVLIVVLYSVVVVIYGFVSYDCGYVIVCVEGDVELFNLQLQYFNELVKIVEDNFLQFQQQVICVNQVEV